MATVVPNLPFTGAQLKQTLESLAEEVIPQERGGSGTTSLGDGLITPLGQLTPRPIDEQVALLRWFIVTDPEYGAVGDNATLNDAAFAAAIAAAIAAGGGVVYIPEGKFRVAGAITTNASNIFILGSVQGATEVLSTSLTADVFVFTGSSQLTNCRIANLTVGHTSGSARSAGASVKFDDCYRCGAENVQILRPFEGFVLIDCTIFWLDKYIVAQPTVSTGRGVRVNGGNDQYITNGIIEGAFGSQPQYGYLIEKTGAIWGLKACAVLCGTALGLIPDAGQVVQFGFFAHCAWDSGSQNNVVLNASAVGSSIRSIGFTDCWSATGALSGVVLVGGDINGVHWNGGRIVNNGQHGFIADGGTAFSVNNSIIAGNSAAAAGTYDAFRVANGLSNFRFVGNKCNPTDGFSNIQASAARIGSSCDNYVVALNQCNGNVAGIIDGTASPSPVGKIVTLNLGA